MAKDNFESLAPEWSWVYFGDGYMAQIVGMVPGKDSAGKDVWKMTLIPTKELAKRFEIGMDMLDENMTIRREYPVDMLVQLNSDPAWTRYLCFLNFNGQVCPNIIGLRIYQESEKIHGLRRMTDLLRAENAYLTEQLEKAKTNVLAFIKDHIMSIASEMNVNQVMQGQQFGTTGMQPASPVRNV